MLFITNVEQISIIEIYRVDLLLWKTRLLCTGTLIAILISLLPFASSHSELIGVEPLAHQFQKLAIMCDK